MAAQQAGLQAAQQNHLDSMATGQATLLGVQQMQFDQLVVQQMQVAGINLKNRGDAVHLDVEAAIPSRNVDKDSSRKILREVTPVDLVNSRKHIY